MKTRLIPLLQHYEGWRLSVIVTLSTMLGAAVVVSIMDLILKGGVTADYLITGLVTAAIVAPPSLMLLSNLLREIAVQQQAVLSASVSRAEAQLKVALESTDEGILMIARDGSVLATNARFLELWRVPQELANAGLDEPLMAHVLDQLVDPDAFLAKVRRLYDGSEEARDTLQFKDGRVFSRYTRALSIGTEQGRIWCFKDITEQSQSELALIASHKFLQTIIDNAPVRIFWKDRDLRYLGCNPLFARDAGLNVAADLIGKDDYQMTWSDRADLYRKDDRAVIESGVAKLAYEEPQTTPDGREIWLSTSKIPLRGADNQVIGILGVYDDISERKQLADALRQREKYQRTLLDTFPFMVWLKDEQSRFLAVNQVFANACGCTSPEELTGKSDLNVWTRELADVYRADDLAVLKSGKPKSVEEPLNAGGETIWIETYKSPVILDEKIIGTVGFARDISERKQAEMVLLYEKQFSEDSLNALPSVFYMFDATGRFVRWNHLFSKITGYADAELVTMGATDFFAGEDKLRVGAAMQRVFSEGQSDVEADFQTKDGRKLPYHFTGQRSTIGDQTYLLGVGVDISERRRTQRALETERSHLHTLVSTIPDLIWLKAVDGTYLSCNPEFERFFGASENDILGKTDYDFVTKELADSFRDHDRAAMAINEPTRNEAWITYASDGRRVFLETTKMPMRTPDGRLVGVLGVGHDITEREAHQKQLEHMAHFDNLTGLPNRVLLADRLQQAMAQAQRHDRMLAVAYLDLDGFKAINDLYGHQVGDLMLTALSGHMKHALREGDTLARLGGDEFVAILLDLPDVESTAPMLSRLLAATGEVVYENGNALRVSASLGVTFYPQAEAIDADQLLRQADQAMYQAKLAGKNRYHIFDTEQDRSVRGHHESLERIKQALNDRELVLYYQPKVNMRTGEVIGAEALIRWQHPELGLLPPAVFLPLIADHPLAIEVGEWVLDTTLKQIENWKSAGLSLPISVNIDAIQLEQADFVDRLRQRVAAHPVLEAGDLELEVLETSALEDIAQVSSVILACREMGVGFALDDFGTGYSSLTYLKRLPAGMLKIDQSFVRDMLDDPDDLAILNGVLGLASAFRRQTIAEGVETLAHGEMLLQLGCELAQGYAIARPMPAEDIPVWLAAWRPDASWLNHAPTSRDDLPILFASVEHRAWLIRVVSYIRGEGETPPPLHHQHCRFGQWLKAEIGLSKESRLAIEVMAPLHIEIHELASELIRMKQDGNNEAAMARLSELYPLRDRLLSKLQDLLQEG